jgi:putative hydrolase of the HAD superfamily
VRAVLFDADGVLQKPRVHWLDVLVSKGWPTAEIAAFFKIVDSTLDGHAPMVPLADAFVAERGLPLTSEENLAMWLDIETDAEALAVVDEVRAAGVRTFLATNQLPERGEWMRENLDFDAHLDRQFYSNELGVAKPDPAYFTAICDATGVAPEEALFVDDRHENVAGAREAGLLAEFHHWDAGPDDLRSIMRRHGVLG